MVQRVEPGGRNSFYKEALGCHSFYYESQDGEWHHREFSHNLIQPTFNLGLLTSRTVRNFWCLSATPYVV